VVSITLTIGLSGAGSKHVASTAKQLDSAGAARRPESAAASPARKQKLTTLLITEDEQIWPRVGQSIPTTASVAQFDDIDSAQARLESGNPAIVIWDARGKNNATAVLGRLQRHCDRVAIVVLDADDRRGYWESSVRLGQIAGFVAAPIETAELSAVFARASEEAQSRAALLGVEAQTSSSPQTKASAICANLKWLLLVAVLAAIAFGAFQFLRPSHVKSTAVAVAIPAVNPLKSIEATPPTAPLQIAVSEDATLAKVDALLEHARQAMLDRRYIEPANDNALNHYRNALLEDPSNGEARQGLDRLATVLLARAQTSIEQRKFDQALQALESARTISPGDPRAVALDVRIASQRAEIGATNSGGNQCAKLRASWRAA
jgi:tetratricopeptide (TPR) repeat protein